MIPFVTEKLNNDLADMHSLKESWMRYGAVPLAAFYTNTRAIK